MKSIFRQTLTFMLTLTIIITMCFGGIGTAKVHAAETEQATALYVFDGGQLVKEYTLDDLWDIAAKEGDVNYKFSGYNRNPTFSVYGDPDNEKTPPKRDVRECVGPTVAGILEDAGITYTDDQMITFEGSDGVGESIVAGQLFEERYYFPNGEMSKSYKGTEVPTAAYADAEPVVPIIDLHRRTEDPEGSVLRFGQTAPNDQNVAFFVKGVADADCTDGSDPYAGSIVVGEKLTESWESITSANFDGGVVLPGTVIKPVIPASATDSKGIYTKKISVYYTIDGSEPGYGDQIFNYAKWLHCDEYMDDEYGGDYINPPVLKEEGTYTIKYKVIGYGKMDSETTTFTYNVVNPEKPDAPEITDISGTDHETLEIQWTAVEGADSYEIYRLDKETAEYVLIGTTIETTYTDSGILTGEDYSYGVKACVAVNEKQSVASDMSEPEEGATELGTPAITKVTAIDSYSTKVTWGAVAGADGYRVYLYDIATGKYQLRGTTEGTAFTDSQLNPGSEYHYTVEAYCTLSDGSQIKSTRAKRVMVTTPELPSTVAAPKMISAARTGYGSIQIKWSKVTDAEGYKIYRYDAVTKKYSLVKTITSGSTVSWKNTGLKTGRKYTYKVKAYRKADGSEIQSVYSGTKSATPSLNKPVLKSAARTGYSSIQIKWSKVAGANGYKIYRYDSVTKKYTLVKTITKGSTVSWKNTGLKTGRKYTYKIKAYRSVDKKQVLSSYSGTRSATPSLTKPVISKLTAGSKSVMVRWNKVSGANGYEIYRAASKNGKYSRVKTITKGSTVSWKNTGLKKGKTYYYKVKAYRIVDKKNVYSSSSSVKYIKSK